MIIKSIKNPYNLSIKEVIDRLGTNPNMGLDEKEVEKRMAVIGPNLLDFRNDKSIIQLFLEQFLNPLVWVLLIAAILAFVFEEWLEGFAILIVILINALIGFFMELQAMRSMNALRKLADAHNRVIREGKDQIISASNLVPGDLIFVKAGDVVPADARIIHQTNLGIKEAALTGESSTVSKHSNQIKKTVVLAERANCIFKGTTVVRGNAHAIITATGKDTELGHIAKMTHRAQKEATPLEQKLNKLSQKLLWLTLILVAAIFLLGIFQGRSAYLMIKTAIALAISAIPEGLPIVATIALARGMLRLASHQVIVKKLNAVQTLGETDVIFTDKTGTLTENDLSATILVLENEEFPVYDKADKEQLAQTKEHQKKVLKRLLEIGTLCNNANHVVKQIKFIGDPLEVAILDFVHQATMDIDAVRNAHPRISEIPFDSSTKIMGTLHSTPENRYLICVKGALEMVLENSTHLLTPQGSMPLVERDFWLEKAKALAKRGLRILAFAYRETDQVESAFIHDLTLVGVLGFLDPPRHDIQESIATCKRAGIQVIMVTGDFPETARNIALKTGLIEDEEDIVIHGGKLKSPEELPKEDFKKMLRSNVFARVSPEQKLQLIAIYQKKGHTVGMTGDGINDAPALKKSDIGIAMGVRGTEASKEVADLILKDDSFKSIVVAIRQGRGIFENIREFVIYLLSCNLSELLVVAMAFFFNLGTPLLPLQLLFINMVTDVFPALALGMNQEPKNVMNHPPKSSKTPIISRETWVNIIFYSFGITLSVMGILLFTNCYWEASAQAINNYAFYTLILAQLWHVFNLPSPDEPFFNNSVTNNPFIWLAILICLIITGGVFFIPVVSEVLNLQALSLEEIWLILGFSFVPVVLIQFYKRLGRN